MQNYNPKMFEPEQFVRLAVLPTVRTRVSYIADSLELTPSFIYASCCYYTAREDSAGEGIRKLIRKHIKKNKLAPSDKVAALSVGAAFAPDLTSKKAAKMLNGVQKHTAMAVSGFMDFYLTHPDYLTKAFQYYLEEYIPQVTASQYYVAIYDPMILPSGLKPYKRNSLGKPPKKRKRIKKTDNKNSQQIEDSQWLNQDILLPTLPKEQG